jgi:hypothetical protein
VKIWADFIYVRTVLCDVGCMYLGQDMGVSVWAGCM